MAMNTTKRRRLLGRFHLVLSAFLAFLVWVGATALATRPAFKALIDLTPQARFTVGDETRALLRELEQQDLSLRVDTFYGRLPTPQTGAQRHTVTIHRRIQELTDDLLDRLRELGGDRVEVHHYDVLGDVAASRGRIDQLGGLAQDDSVVVSVGKRHKELSPFLDLAEIDFPSARPSVAPGAQQALPTFKVFKGEEAIATAVRSLLVEGTPRIYFLQGYREAGELTGGVADSYSELVVALRAEGFEVGLLNLEKDLRIPDDADVLAVLEPRAEISPRAAEVLFRWLRSGGRFVLDLSWSEVSGPSFNPSWDELGGRCGFRYGADLVCHLVPDPSVPQSPGVDGIVARNVVAQGVSAQHPITRPLAQRNLFPQFNQAREILDSGSTGVAGVTFEPILRSGPWGWLAPRDLRIEDADYRKPTDANRFAPRNLGAVVDIRPDSGDRTGHVVLLSGIAFVNGGLMQRNGDLALNIFNWLTQRTALVTVRGNRYRSQRIEVAPQQIERTRNLVLYLVPGALLALGLVVVWSRRQG